jgi:hypothetical protein
MFKFTAFILVFTVCVLAFSACRKPIIGSVPVIEYEGISKYALTQNGQDSLLLEISFSDDDGDIGSDTEKLLYVSDSRTDSLVATYLVPRISQSDRARRRKGSISVIVYSACCRYSDGTSCYANPNSPTDTVRYKIRLQDRMGNLSNTLTTDRITLNCE